MAAPSRAGLAATAGARQAVGMNSSRPKALPIRIAALALALFIAAPLAAANDPARPGFEWQEQRRYYVVTGRTVDELLQQLRQATPEKDAEDSAARAEQTLDARFELDPLAQGCRLARLHVRLDVVLHLPRWQPEGERPQRLAERWDRMYPALLAHEEGHRDIAVQVARELYDGLRALPAAGDCRDLHRQAQKLLLQARLTHALRDGAYERRTEHGLAQGARL
jgi:predicted secreted Zn-dependent protease